MSNDGVGSRKALYTHLNLLQLLTNGNYLLKKYLHVPVGPQLCVKNKQIIDDLEAKTNFIA